MKDIAPRLERISVFDSHTGGEPTRLVVSGGPDLGKGSLLQRQQRFENEFDYFRSAIVNEPRGNDVMVGALLCKPSVADCVAGVMFFNNVGSLGMCGHGVIGVAVTLAHLGRIDPGQHKIETPVGTIGFKLDEDLRRVTFQNVPSYRYRKEVAVEVPGFGSVVGDIAWGGNWFFLVRSEPDQIRPQHLEDLLTYTRAIRNALDEQKITGHQGKTIDHVEVFAETSTADGRNFVLCPGGQWDRSPCGTGTSAKLACLAADGLLAPGKLWHQESIIGTHFEARYRLPTESELKKLGNTGVQGGAALADDVADSGGVIVPSITGTASVTAEAQLILDPEDPFCYGIPV
ncbi:4-hydroxyproline epimerase [Novipirellula aureliae]|uniref:4-hydroxyproline epimerase n=1 Tax=Novipirellula aureliae TaxID=2527966 RepID=A0A5C6ED35_9BACT|nr:proline racemase family protein [Novipirellula aureliae]TWU45621.1 4-hydroxyproline epimerase [Novipirellula aureliae]